MSKSYKSVTKKFKIIIPRKIIEKFYANTFLVIFWEFTALCFQTTFSDPFLNLFFGF